MLTLKTHNILDYVAGAFLLFVPLLFGFSAIEAARNVYIISGFSLIGYSLLTKYQYALWKTIPLGVHMSLDVILGVIVMLSPWIFGYRDFISTGQEMVHYAFALGLFAIVAFTEPEREGVILDSQSSASPDSEYFSKNRKAG